MNTYISAIDYYLPSQVVKTRDMMAETKPERLGFSETLIEDLVGIIEVRHASDDEKPSSLAINAANKALAKFDGNIDDIGMVIFCGMERDFIEPSTAHIIQYKLGLKNAVCFDVTNACMGFMSGIQIANAAIVSGMIKHALVCTGEKTSEWSKSMINTMLKKNDSESFQEKIGTLTLGDAGVAGIISPSETASGIIGLNYASKGGLAGLCHYKYENGVLEGKMKMREICNAGLRLHKNMFSETLSSMDITRDEIDCLITHQVGQVAWVGSARVLGLKEDIMTRTFDTLGNITSATFGVNYAMALEEERVKTGDLVLAAMAGSGLSTCQVGIVV
ncbi:MAG: 3-oxoacyl-ACP synthase III family protein [Cellvibrionaceae bacterium]